MNYSTAVFLINDKVRAVVIDYDGEEGAGRSKLATFKTLDVSIKRDDLVVIPTSTRVKFTVVKVVEVDAEVDFDAAGPVGWIVGKVDLAPYNQTVAEEATAIATIKAAEIKSKRDELAAKLVANHGAVISKLALASHTEDAPAS